MFKNKMKENKFIHVNLNIINIESEDILLEHSTGLIYFTYSLLRHIYIHIYQFLS